jgi:hypothetical protein
LALDSAHSDCAFFRGRIALQKAGPGIARAVHLLSGIDTARLSEPTPFDAKFFLGHAAKQTGDMKTAMTAWEACLELMDSGQASGTMRPNVYSAIAGIYRASGRIQKAQAAVSAGLAAAAAAPTAGPRPKFLQVSSALPDLHDTAGFVAAILSDGDVNAARQIFRVLCPSTPMQLQLPP